MPLVFLENGMRRQRARGTTTRAVVVNAGLEVIDKVGIPGLTIRAVAAAAAAPTMSLYSHFANKEQLLDLMYAEVASRLYADGEYATWQKALEGLCHQIRGVLLAHPNWLPLLARPAFPTSVPLRERILGMMTTAGMTPEVALGSLTNAGLMALGLITVELSFRGPDGGSGLTKRFDHIRELSEQPAAAEAQPLTQAAFAKMRHLDLSRNFSDCVSTFVRGLEAPR
jgi:AcrR family transcriptional regulator